MEKKPTLQGGQSGTRNDMWLARAVRENAPPDLPVRPPLSPLCTSLYERQSIRRAIPCSILVDFGTVYAIASNILNLSLTGVYVDLDVTGAQLGDSVEVVMAFAYRGEQIERRIPATIARLQSQGVGLKFEAYDDQTYTDLVNLLYAA
jgi:PilZ domain